MLYWVCVRQLNASLGAFSMTGLRSLFLILAVFALVAAGCGGGEQDVPNDAIAVVGDTEIARADFDAYIAQAKRGYQTQKRPFPKPGTTEYNTLKQQIVTYLVQRAQYREEAEDLGVEVSDKQVDARLQKIIKDVYGGSRPKFEKQLKTQGISEAQARDIIRDQLLSDGIMKKVTADVKITDKDIEAYYAKNKASYGTPETREVRHILVKDKATANRLYTQIKGGADFGKLARKFSLDPGSKVMGGKLTITKGQFVAPFEQTAFLLPKNSLSRPVKTQYGYHLIQPLSETKPARTTPLKDVKSTIRQQLQQTKRSSALQKWAKDVRKEYEDQTSYQVGFAPPKTQTNKNEDS